jgi:hypothetical protein
MKLPAARSRGIYIKKTLVLSILIPAKAGIQKNKITGFRVKCGMTEIR